MSESTARAASSSTRTGPAAAERPLRRRMSHESGDGKAGSVMTEAGISHFAPLTEPERFVLDERPLVQDGAERIVRVTECGVCGSDLKMYSGAHPIFKPPLILGHEFYGIVEGDGGSIPAGTEVAIYPPVGCGHCYQCTRGLEYRCAEMQFYGGEFQGGPSGRGGVRERTLIPIPAGVPADQRVLIEPLAVAVHA